MEASQRDYIKKMVAISNLGNMDQVYQGHHSLPKPYKTSAFETKMWNLNGTITSPYYGGEFVEEYYKKDREIHIVLELPHNITSVVRSGSLIIELEVDIREDQGWVEEVFHLESKNGVAAFQDKVYKHYTTSKNWTEAEAECKKDGGHLASVTNQEIYEVVTRVAGGEYVWIGGWKGFGEWSWTDNSSWGDFFTLKSWTSGNCLALTTKGYGFVKMDMETHPCYSEKSFICQVQFEAFIRKTSNTIQLTYQRDQLDFTEFHVWYRYKAVSKHMLKTWNDKMMTGFRLSWRIENMPRIARINEIGRGVKTSQIVAENMIMPPYVYMAVLELPTDFQQNNENTNVVVELDIVMGHKSDLSDKVFAFTSFHLFILSKHKSWSESEAFCKNEGGQLASIHSHWEQMLAVKAARGKKVWLGGRKMGNQWHWADNTTLGFTNWENGRPLDAFYLERLAMFDNGQWKDLYETDSESYPLCQGKTLVIQESGLKRFTFPFRQLDFFPFHILFQGQSIRNSNSSREEERRSPGFTLNWFLEDINGTLITEKLPARPEDWDHEIPIPKYKELLLAEMVQLASYLRIKQNMTREQMLTMVIREQMQNIGITNTSSCDMNQIKSEVAIPKLISTVDQKGLKTPIHEEDVATGIELFHAITYCPSSLSMDFELFTFVDQLLAKESSRTILQSFVNLFRSGLLDQLAKVTPVSKFYFALASKLNLQYGNILLATSTKSEVQAAIQSDWPFFTNHTDILRTCLFDMDCVGVQNIIEDLGKTTFHNNLQIFLFILPHIKLLCKVFDHHTL